MNKIIFVFFIMSFYACVVPKIELTEQEEALETKLKKEFACDDFEFRHDYHAIKANKKDAMFMVTLCDDFCNKDSLTLCKEAIRLTKIIKPILSHKNNYEGVIFYMSIVVKDKKIDWDIEQCSKTIKVSLEDLDIIGYSK